MQVYNTKDLQDILKIGRNVAYELMKSDGFPSFQINTKYFVTETALNEWLESAKGKTFNV